MCLSWWILTMLTGSSSMSPYQPAGLCLYQQTRCLQSRPSPPQGRGGALQPSLWGPVVPSLPCSDRLAGLQGVTCIWAFFFGGGGSGGILAYISKCTEDVASTRTVTWLPKFRNPGWMQRSALCWKEGMLRSGSPTFRHSGQRSLQGCRGPKQHTPGRSRDTSPASIQELCYLCSLHHRLHRGCHHPCGSCSPHPSGVEQASALHTLQFAHDPLDTEQAPACFTHSDLDNTIEPTLPLPPSEISEDERIKSEHLLSVGTYCLGIWHLFKGEAIVSTTSCVMLTSFLSINALTVQHFAKSFPQKNLIHETGCWTCGAL